MHRALGWNMPHVVRMHSREGFSFFPFLFLSRFFLFSICARSAELPEKSEWRLKRADQNLLEVPSLYLEMTSDFALSFTGRDTYAPRYACRANAREFGPWKLIVAIMRLRIGERCYGTSYLYNFFLFFLRFDTVSWRENINIPRDTVLLFLL